ncbi:MAG: protease inhibitor I42 family protein [Actinomycetota bacterium]
MKPKAAAALSAMLIAVLLSLFTAGCSVGGKAVEYRDPSVPIVVEKGQEFVIVLESNPSAGYRWQLGEELDAGVLSLQKVEYEEPSPEERGKPGEERWTFKAEGLGRTSVVLVYSALLSGGESAKVPGRSDFIKAGVKESEETAAGDRGEGSAKKEAEEEGVEAGDEEGRRATESGVGNLAEASGAGEGETLVFSVWVREKGAADKKARKHEDPAETVEVKEGYRFSLVLESDPTSGRQWWLAEPLDKDLLCLVDVSFEAQGRGKAGEGEEAGAPGKEYWTFEALGSGKTKVTLGYGRPWEKGDPQETRIYEVDILPAEGEAAEAH